MSGELSWIPIYEELARKLLEFRHNREPLVRLVYDRQCGHWSMREVSAHGGQAPVSGH